MIRARAKTTVKGDDQVKAFLKRMRAAQEGAYVSVGIHEGAGQYQDGPMVAEVALWNEFGTRFSPERSWMRSAIDEAESLINRWREELVGKMLHEGWTVERALEAMGFRLQVLLQNKIKSNVPPPNAPGTLAAKAKAGVPPETLINTQLMLRSVTFKVHSKGDV